VLLALLKLRAAFGGQVTFREAVSTENNIVHTPYILRQSLEPIPNTITNSMITNTIYRSMHVVPELQRQFRRVVLRLPHRQRLVNHFGQKLWVDPSELHGFYLYYEQEYDDYIFKFLSTQIAKYQYLRALDLGANIGIYTVFLATQIKRVDAFEPEPKVLERLQVNLKLNGLTNVTVHNSCVGKASGTVTFIPPGISNQGIGAIAAATEQGVQRSCISLDDFFSKLPQEACLIKMDIEGGEWLALQGGQRVLTHRKAPLSMLLEVHPEEIQRLGGSVSEVRSLLESMNLQVKGLAPTGLESLDSGKTFRFWWATSEDF
jgi:FkbM family methyltransferase